MVKGGHSHRATLKKDHKPFKSKHATKSQLKNQSKGRVEKNNGSGKTQRVKSKIDRRNTSKQVKENKLQEVKVMRRLFEGSQGAEKIVTVIGLTKDVRGASIAAQIFGAEMELKFRFDAPCVADININRFKSKLKIIVPDEDDLLSVMDAAKVSDFVIFGLSALEEITPDYGEPIIRTIIAQGVASVIGVLPNVVSAYPKRNLQLDIRQSLLSYFTHFFPGDEKLYALETESELQNCIRTICQKFPKSVTWRDARGYMVADKITWEGNGIDNGLLVVEGTVRGIGFSSNRLVHIPGFGDFQIDHIEKLLRSHLKVEIDIDQDAYLYPNEYQETLEELNPEEVDMEDASLSDDDDYDSMGIRMEGKNYFDDQEQDLSRPKKVPKGTSEYQARWFIEDVDDENDDDSDNDSDIGQGMSEDGNEGDMDMEFDEESRNTADEMDVYEEISPEEEERQLREFRALSNEDLEFPDEEELHPSESAKERFAGYRGVKSLANCNWDYQETDTNEPSIWKRLLRISNFRATKNKICKDSIKEVQINVGNKVRLYVKAPLAISEKFSASKGPFIIYGLLQHEHKLSVANFSFEHWEDVTEPIPSNDTLIVQYGPRRQVIQPIFNQASNNSNNVHKMERFAHEGSTVIATTIAPVLFSNAPAIFFRVNSSGALNLVGRGTFLDCDHKRVLAERVVLTGHPVKIHKKLVTVRYMFFNAEDINWFKAVPLFTRSGRTGFIKESLGTHGYFKATFDGKLTSQDVVAMSLYKRAWPVYHS
ncbi:uncharacterized protein PRCAT00005153001 [Priceomyces carsonii]|uniref:uncharacterized protein n=1 Tax=Priceomyces carsonii TaxID=28549 RepID=UPI002ED91E83|nr:unnamed protein product [Priceomyces carsonii]